MVLVCMQMLGLYFILLLCMGAAQQPGPWQVDSFSEADLLTNRGMLARHPELVLNMSDIQLRESLRDKTIVMIGDSTTRYIYMALAYYLEHLEWPSPVKDDKFLQSHGTSMCNEQLFKGWADFLAETNAAMGKHEYCECVRGGPHHQWHVENRHYRSPDLNASIVFFWFGRDLAMYDPRFFQHDPFTDKCRPGDAISLQREYALNGSSLPSCNYEKLLNFTESRAQETHKETYPIVKMAYMVHDIVENHRPDVVMINWGLHHMFWSGTKQGTHVDTFMRERIKSLRSKGHLEKTRIIWRQTTPTCEPEVKRGPIAHNQCKLSLVNSKDDFEKKQSTRVHNNLVKDGVLELFDTADMVEKLFNEEQRRQRIREDIGIKEARLRGSNATDAELRTSLLTSANDLFWNGLHYNAWPNAQMARAFVYQINNPSMAWRPPHNTTSSTSF